MGAVAAATPPQGEPAPTSIQAASRSLLPGAAEMDLEIPRITVWLLFLPEHLCGHCAGFVPAFPAQPYHWHNLFLQTFVQYF